MLLVPIQDQNEYNIDLHYEIAFSVINVTMILSQKFNLKVDRLKHCRTPRLLQILNTWFECEVVSSIQFSYSLFP